MAFAPYASRSPFEVWIVPRRHEADFGRATAAGRGGHAPRRSARCCRASPSSLDGPPYNLVLHTAPLREQVDATYHWHWEIHPRLREIAGLELGTGLPVNPVSPEDAVEELLGARRADGRWNRVDGARRRRRPSVTRAPSPAVFGPTSARRPHATALGASIPLGELVVADPTFADLREPFGRLVPRRTARRRQ